MKGEALMKTDLSNGIWCLVLFLVCSLALSGCASFPNPEFPKYSYDQLKPSETKPSMDYDLRYLWSKRENAQVVTKFQEEINNIFSKSNLFSKYSPGNANSDYHFSIIMKDESDELSTTICAAVTLFSLTVIPVKVRDELILTIDVKKDDKVIKQYQYKHYVDTWIQLFLIFMTPTHSPEKVMRGVWDDMLLAFLHDFEQDNILAAKRE